MGWLLHHLAGAPYYRCSSPSGQVCSCPAGRQQSHRQSPVHRSFTLGPVPALQAAHCKNCKGDGGGRLGLLEEKSRRIQLFGFEKLDYKGSDPTVICVISLCSRQVLYLLIYQSDLSEKVDSSPWTQCSTLPFVVVSEVTYSDSQSHGGLLLSRRSVMVM